MKKTDELLKLSIFIICKNEAHIIEETLTQAAKLADEIILVDSGSTDATVEIAKPYVSKIYTQEWLGYAKQKNYALSLCSHKWVLSLDADEVLSDALIAEIKSIFHSGKHKSRLAFRLPRLLFINRKPIHYGGFYPDYQLRLFQKAFGRFQDLPVHESVEIWDEQRARHITTISFMEKFKASLGLNFRELPITDLNNYIKHFSYSSVAELETAFIRYARLSNKKSPSPIRILKALYAFIYKYFIRLGFLDGLIGLRLAFINAHYTYLKYSDTKSLS